MEHYDTNTMSDGVSHVQKCDGICFQIPGLTKFMGIATESQFTNPKIMFAQI